MWFVFFIREEKMEKTKARKEVNDPLFIVKGALTDI